MKYKIITKLETTDYVSFEHDIWNIQMGSRAYTIIGLYQPPKRTGAKVNNANFLDQLTDLLSNVVPKHQDIIILGDFNILINDSEDQDAQILQDTFNAFSLKQNVNIPTHNLGHTIDLIITSNDYQRKLIPESYISDHTMITLDTNIPKPKPETEIKYVCNLTDNKVQEFTDAFNNIPILNSSNLKDATNQLNSEMLRTIDKIAPKTS